MMDPMTLFILGVVCLVASIPTNSYGLAGTSIALLFFAAMMTFV